MDILKYVLAQATDWCAGFLVHLWWRYLRVRSADTVKWRVNFWVGQKEEKVIPLPSALCSIKLYHAAHCYPTIGQNIQICRFAPTALFCHMYRSSLRKKHLSFTACWCRDISADRVGNDDDDDNNNNSDDNDNRLFNFLGHLTHTNSNFHVTQFVTFLPHALCVFSDWSNCTSTIMYVTIVDAYWNRENSTACCVRTYGLLKCRYINLRESAQSIKTASQLYATLQIFKIAFTSF
jgi:hypothetical protein